ncbi:MAG: LysM peptidoglycan-binding domain-containing protein [Burkholderiales bacterium]|nr:LysM peptidoglycan-binding domain-containing protein [Burkholderiales bacterium]
MGKSVIRTSALALALLLLPSLAAAAGLGKLTVFSALGQPLKAEIELLALQKGEADNLSVRLPPADVFRKANIEYSGALLSVKFRIEQRSEDRYVVVLSSGQPINEPFLDLMVELDWATGRLVREYTFLLDPPEYKPPQAAPAMATPVTEAPEIKSVEMPKQPLPDARPSGMAAPRAARVPESAAPKAIAPKPVAPKAAAPSAAAPKEAAPKAVASYQVKRGDTLTKIANANRPDSVSLQQMLIALYRSNADQFDGDNINRIRAGKILNIPDMEVAASVDQEEATRTILAQAADFNEYRRKLGAAVAAAPERADERRQSVSGKITARVEDKPAAAKEAKDQLKLSQTEEAGKPGAKRSPQGLQEDLFAKEKEIKEANERIAMLEKNLQDMQKLLELKSAPGAQLQQQAAKAGAAKPVEPAKAPEPAPAKPVEAQKAPEPAKADEPAKVEEAAKAAPTPPAPKPAAPQAPRKVAPPPPPPAPEPSLLDEILGNELALYGGGGFLVLLFAGYFYYAWRRKKSLQKMESSVMVAPDLATDSVFGAGAKIDTGAGESQTEFGPSGAATASDVEEVDPIAEADVYMAYGRDMQAEEILKEALAKDPSRQPIRAKLLEIYANRKDAKAFAVVAAELQAATGGAGADWDKAAALGAQLDPGNPLYGGSQAEAHAVIDTQVVSGTERAPDIVLETGGKAESSPGLDFDLGLGEPEQTEPPEAAAEGAAETEVSAGLDFDLGLSEPEKSDAPPSEPAAEAEPEAAADLGFDLDLGGGEEKKSESAEAEQRSSDAPGSENAAADTPADATASIDFDFELPDAAEESAPSRAFAEPESPEASALEAPETPASETPEAAVPEVPSETPALELPAVPEPESPEPPALELPAGSTPEAQGVPASEATEVPAIEVPKSPATEAAAGESGVDFDFNLNLPEQKEEATSAPLDLSSISLDLGAPGEAALSPDAHWQEVATKLDLAKAYQEMGDMEGARELLDEVLKEGDTAQQQQAQNMLAALG